MNQPGVKVAQVRRSDGHVRLSQLDGLRALAILMVVGFHVAGLSWGWTGVQIFFVLSGFLITGILRHSRHDLHFWGPFYIKRVTRIAPPLVIFFVIMTVTGGINWKTTGVGYLLFLANVIQAMPSTPMGAVGVTWSLAVEEHFYFLWPVAVRFLPRNILIALAAGTALLSPLARALATPHLSTWRPIYYWTPFQVDGMALGSLLSLLFEDQKSRLWLQRNAWAILVLPLLVLTVLARSFTSYRYSANSVLFNGTAYSLVVLASAGILLVLVLRPTSPVSRIFAVRPLVFVGTVSYGLYLFHLPVMTAMQVLMQQHGLTHPLRNVPIALAVALLFSWLSFRWYEQPLVRWGRRLASAMGAEKREPHADVASTDNTDADSAPPVSV